MYEKNESDIKEIKQWLEKQTFLPKDLGSGFIHTFLWGCQGDKEKTKKVLANYFYARQSIPEIFYDRDPLHPKNTDAWKYSWFLPLKRKQNGCRVYVGVAVNSSGYDFVAYVRQVFMCFDLIISNGEWENGDRIVVIGYDNVKRHNLPTYNMYITRKLTECERENFLPGKLKALHHVHVPSFMKKIHDRFKPFLTAEDEKVIVFHRDLASLHGYIDPAILPVEFGGVAGSLPIMAEEWYAIMVSRRNFYLEEEKKRRSESKGLTSK